MMSSTTSASKKKKIHSKLKSKSIEHFIFPPFFRILALYKKRRFGHMHASPQQQSQYIGSSQSSSSFKKGPLVPCGTIERMSVNLNEKQLKEALISARYALHKYSAAEDTNVLFKRLVAANATFHEEEECYSYLMTMEASDNRFYDAHVLYKLDDWEILECFLINPTISCPY